MIKTPHNQEESQPKKQAVTTESVENKKNSDQVLQENTVDTELVNALEKLVNLKQQGFLTQEEFVKAKDNLMQSLFNK